MTPFVRQSLYFFLSSYELRQNLRISGQKNGKSSKFFKTLVLFPCFLICLERKRLEKMQI